MSELNSSNFLIYAANNYNNPQCLGNEEFQEDLARFKYIKKILNKYAETGNISERLLLNHIITICNVFGVKPALKMFEYRLEASHWKILKPCLLYLRYVDESQYPHIKLDQHIVQLLRNI